MSTSFSALLRATSPGHEAIVEALRADDEQGIKARDARHAAIHACNSMQEIIESIPSDYRDKCADLLREGYKQVSLLVRTETTLAKWKRHLAVGTFPAHLRGSANQVQFTSGYKDSDAAKAAQKDTDDKHHAYQVARLTSDIAAKQAEVKFLQEACDPIKAHSDMRAALVPLCPAIVAKYKVPRDEIDPETREVTNVVWITSPAALRIRDHVLEDCGAYAQRVIQIATRIATAENAKIEKSKSIAAAATVAAADGADVVMADATLSAALKAEIKRTVMGLMPRDRKGGPALPSKATKKAREAAAATQAKITPGYESVLPGYIVRPRIRALTTFGYSGRRKKRSRPPQQKKEEYVVLAKAEGSKRAKKQKRKARPQQQQQQQKKGKGKGKEKAK
ncbi:hypothetical protein EDB87DRAFT_1692879 [Lactarius vividus]|nr:hypothetical protein EDB87DRAFT_1692879 [Lactarius vividus]